MDATYVSSGAFLRDVDRIFPSDTRRRATTPFTRQTAPTAIDALAPPLRAEVASLYALAEEGLPTIGPWTPSVGYSLPLDLGEDLPVVFDGSNASIAIARSAIGLGDDGGGGMLFVLPDGTVAALDVGAVYEWQWTRFPTLGAFLWTMVHADAVQRGAYEEGTFHQRLVDADCVLAAAACGVDASRLPPLPAHPTVRPAWLGG
jgi:hypothetical protein